MVRNRIVLEGRASLSSMDATVLRNPEVVGDASKKSQSAQEEVPLWLLILSEPPLMLFRALHTVKFGLVLLSILAILSIVGSIISANGDNGPDLAKHYVFNTWWFLLVMGLLCINLVLATFDRSVVALSLYWKQAFRDAPAFYKKSKHSAAIPGKRMDPDTVEQILSKQYTVVRRKGNSFYAQRGLISRTGFTIIHIGLLATMAAGFYRILADEFRIGVFDATVILPEGLTTENYYTRIDRLQKPIASNLEIHELPFLLRLLDFHVENHPGSTVAKKYASLIELKDPKSGFTKIAEVTMETPLLFNGYKVTQNSYSPTDKVKRGHFRITDRKTGRSYNVDASAKDPVMLDPIAKSPLFFQVDGLAPGANFSVMDLRNRTVLAQGVVESARAPGPVPLDLTPHEASLRKSQYAFLVAALFPHFAIDSAGQPTTLSEQFINPAVLMMLFKNGRPNGYLWLFQNEEAARIMGQPHPEVSSRFDGWRIRDGKDGSSGLLDYEVQVSFVDKSTSRSIGSSWAVPGTIVEVQGIDPQILSRPNVTPDDVSLRRRDSAQAGGGSEPQTAEGGFRPTQFSDVVGEETAAGTAGSVSGDRFIVRYLGTQDGYVSYLGFMKDPSVFWIYLGCIVIVGGTMIAWLITYREAWFHLDKKAGVLYAATQVRGYSKRAHRHFDQVLDILALPPEKKTKLKPTKRR